MRIDFLTYYRTANILATNKQKQYKPAFRVNNSLSCETRDIFIKNKEIAFQGKTSTKNFKIKDIPNLHCPYCGRLMLSDKQIKDFVDDVAPKKGEALIAALEKYEDEGVFTGVNSENNISIFRDKEQEIVDIIKNHAKQNQNLSLEEIVKSEANMRIKGLLDKQMTIVERLEEYVNRCNATKEEKEELRRIIGAHKKILGIDRGKEFKRKAFIYDLQDKVKDKKTQEAINGIIVKLPNSEKDVASFFVKYSKRSPKVIAEALVRQTKPSADHLIARNDNGPNEINNYLCTCSDCNTARQHMPFHQYQKRIPDFEQRLIRQFREIISAQTEGLLGSEYDDYISNIIKKLKILSCGEIDIKLEEIQSDDSGNIEKSKKRKRIYNLRKKLDKAKNQRNTVNEQIKEIKSIEGYESTTRYQAIKKQIAELEEAIKKSEESGVNTVKQRALLLQLTNQQNRIEQEETLIPLEDKDEINVRIITLKDYMENISGVLSSLNQTILERSVLEDKKSMLKEENRILLEENKNIESAPGFNPNDKSDWDEYKHQQNLLQEAITMLGSHELSKRKKKSLREIIEIAVSAIQEKIKSLQSSNSIKYYENKEKIDKNKDEINSIKSSIDNLEKKVSKYENILEDLCKKTNCESPEKIREEYNYLLEQKKAIDKFLKFPQLKAEFEKLNDDIRRYEIAYQKTRNYKNMSDEEFDSIMSDVE